MKSLLIIPAFLLFFLELRAQQIPNIEQFLKFKDMPDPLTILDGTRVFTKDDWYKKREPEIERLIQQYIYGFIPPSPKLNATIKKIDNNALNGKATYKEVCIELLLPDDERDTIILSLFIAKINKNSLIRQFKSLI
jgi:hypothetical protein